MLLALDGLTDPHNVGAILRSALLFSCDGVILSYKNTAPLNATVSRTSAGALELLAAAGAIRYASSLSATLAAYKKKSRERWHIAGAAAPPQHSSTSSSDGNTGDDSERRPYVTDMSSILSRDNTNGADNVILVMGSEGQGLKPAVSQQCTCFFYVPTAADDTAEKSNSNSGLGSTLPSTATTMMTAAQRTRSLLLPKLKLVESLNVSTAAAILLSQLAKLRGRHM